MKKINRFGVLLGILAGAGSLSLFPVALAQEAEPGPASELMESIDISLQTAQAPPMPPGPPESMMMMMGGPPGIGGPGAMMPPGMPPPDGDGPDELLAMHGGGDLMLIRAGVQSSFSDDQLEKMYKIRTDFEDKSGPKMVELKSQERALRDLLTQADFDKSKAQSIQGKINSLRSDLANLKLDQRIELLNTLSAEQRKELRRSYIKAMDFGPGMMMGHRGAMRMRGHHRGGGGADGQCKPGGKGEGPGGPGPAEKG